MNKFILFAFLLFPANKTNSFVRFLGESTARYCFRFYLTFSKEKLSEINKPEYPFIRHLRAGSFLKLMLHCCRRVIRDTRTTILQYGEIFSDESVLNSHEPLLHRTFLCFCFLNLQIISLFFEQITGTNS